MTHDAMLGDLRVAPLETPLEPVAVLPRACAASAAQAPPTTIERAFEDGNRTAGNVRGKP